MSNGPFSPDQPARGQQRGPNADLFAPFRPPPADGGGTTLPPVYRASDTDREQVTRLLSQALNAGQLDVHEFDQRVKAVYSAKTHSELDTVTRDLVIYPESWRLAEHPGSGSGRLNLFGVMSGFQRRGEWVVPPKVNVFVYWGGGLLDLRNAVFTAPETHIRIWAIMAGAKIIVPRELGLRVHGVAVMAGFDDRASGQGEPGRPQIVVKGFSFWGGVAVVREYIKKRAPLKQRLKER